MKVIADGSNSDTPYTLKYTPLWEYDTETFYKSTQYHVDCSSSRQWWCDNVKTCKSKILPYTDLFCWLYHWRYVSCSSSPRVTWSEQEQCPPYGALIQVQHHPNQLPNRWVLPECRVYSPESENVPVNSPWGWNGATLFTEAAPGLVCHHYSVTFTVTVK